MSHSSRTSTLKAAYLFKYLVLSAGKQRLLSVLSQQIRETDISGLVLSAACLFCHCVAEEGLSGAGVSLKYDATTVIDKPAASQIGDNASAERAFIDVQDVMDIRLRETELRVLDQPAHLLIVFPVDRHCLSEAGSGHQKEEQAFVDPAVVFRVLL